MAESERAARLLEVYTQLKEGAGADVDCNRLFDAAERLVNAERDAETYRGLRGKSPFGPEYATLATATGVSALQSRPTMDAAAVARQAAAEIEAAEGKAASA